LDKNESKVILITGSSRGIGAALAKYFAEKGHKVILNYAKSDEEAHRLYDQIYSYNQNVQLIKADVSDREQVKEMFNKAVSRFGKLNVLINNASINMDDSFINMTDEKWHKVISTNLTGTFICSQEFVFRFKGTEGHIINVASNSGIMGRKNGVNYCCSKSGVITLTKCLALELAPTIKVNCIILGYVDTEEVMERYKLHDPDNLRQLVNTIPLQRLGIPEDICKTVNFLINESSYITGQNIFINGGNYMG